MATRDVPRDDAERPSAASTATLLGDLGLQAGEFIGDKYRLEEVLGSGATGIVVAATNLSLRKRVALKLLLQRHRARRFKREVHALAAIESEHIARVLDDGVHRGIFYLVMELIEGRDLRAVLRERTRVPLSEVASYILQACEPLAHAHARGIIHRDIKPENLFLARARGGEVVLKLLDFSHAKATLEEVQLTEGSALIGTLPYMSPEQYSHPSEVTALSDLWALGVVLFELLAGRRPFSAGTTTALQEIPRIQDALPERLSEACPGMPTEMEEIVLDLLRKDKAERARQIPDVGVLAQRLAAFGGERERALAERVERVLANGSSPLRPEPPSRTRSGGAGDVDSTESADGGKVLLSYTQSAPGSATPPLPRRRRLRAPRAYIAASVIAVVVFTAATATRLRLSAEAQRRDEPPAAASAPTVSVAPRSADSVTPPPPGGDRTSGNPVPGAPRTENTGGTERRMPSLDRGTEAPPIAPSVRAKASLRPSGAMTKGPPPTERTLGQEPLLPPPDGVRPAPVASASAAPAGPAPTARPSAQPRGWDLRDEPEMGKY